MCHPIRRLTGITHYYYYHYYDITAQIDPTFLKITPFLCLLSPPFFVDVTPCPSESVPFRQVLLLYPFKACQLALPETAVALANMLQAFGVSDCAPHLLPYATPRPQSCCKSWFTSQQRHLSARIAPRILQCGHVHADASRFTSVYGLRRRVGDHSARETLWESYCCAPPAAVMAM